eukprot:TRINITY_DN6265_c0_g1_i6.p1 TRINITY_DN6265_c0_g1~~TRINITY_DN6265_c0_g1_i6.p1  ORF type:complete len:290 (-),score=76.94 TRINITY_DN6265_c0_g1_i6:419-1288(-)
MAVPANMGDTFAFLPCRAGATFKDSSRGCAAATALEAVASQPQPRPLPLLSQHAVRQPGQFLALALGSGFIGALQQGKINRRNLQRSSSRSRARLHATTQSETQDLIAETQGVDEDEDILGDGKLLKRVIRPAAEGSAGPIDGDDVTVHYVGTLASDSTEFDSSRAKDEPFSFKLGAGEVIKGWDEAVATMCKGEQAVFTIAPELAYGEAGSGDAIPANSTLKFDIELLDFVEVDTEEDFSLDGLNHIDIDEDEDEIDGYGRKDLGPGGEEPSGKYCWERRGHEVELYL